MSRKFRRLLIIISLGMNTAALAQGQGQSPYSTFGLGDLTDETVGAQDMMGGTGVSFGNTFYVNNLNPALMVKDRVLRGMKYVALNIGANGYYRTLEQGPNMTDDFGLNLSNLSMAFPLTNKWAVGINFKPYSITDFESVVNRNFQGSSAIGSYSYKDYGGLSKVGVTTSHNPVKGLYIGVEGQYYFGNINRDSTTRFMGNSDGYRFSSRTSLTGFDVKGGIAYQQKISKKWRANIGGTYQMGNEVSGEFINVYQLVDNSTGYGESPISDPDTIAIGNRSVSLPSKYKVGLSIEKPMNFVLAAEYGVTDWEGLSKPFDDRAKNMMRNSTEMNFGMEWIPNVSSGKYFDQVFYRIGYKQVETPYLINNQRIKDNSFTAGVSLPLGRGGSYIDLGLAVGRRGVNNFNLVKEDYIRFSLGVSMIKDWFHRPRID